MNLDGTAFIPLERSLLEEAEANPKLDRPRKRILDILKKGSKELPGQAARTWDLSFFRSPIGISQAANVDSEQSLTIKLAHTALSPTNSAVPTGAHTDLPTSLVVTALGHSSEPDTPWYDPHLGHVRNEGGQVLDESGKVLRNVYASGWAGIGARGVLATTLMNAYGVAERILSDTFPDDLDAHAKRIQDTSEILPRDVDNDGPPEEIVRGVSEGEITTYEDWRAVDAEEIRRGEEVGKERERMAWDEAKEIARGARAKAASTFTT